MEYLKIGIKLFIISFIAVVFLGKIVIPFFKKIKCGQFIREDGPKEHLSKTGTPTMGGIMFLTVFVILALLIRIDSSMIIIIISTLGFGIIGFVDDYLKLFLKRNLGLTEIQKLLLQIIVIIGVCYILSRVDSSTHIIIPFINKTINLGILYWPFVVCVFLGTTNGVNFTDGLDGLSASVTIPVCLFISFLGFFLENYSIFVSGSIFAGSLFGYLIYNSYKASVFMGDTGSLAIGGFVSACMIIFHMEMYILIIGIIYLIEVLSVIIQVGSYKLRKGKRVFKMAPIHHHFEALGYNETKIVVSFTAITVIFCLFAVLSLI